MVPLVPETLTQDDELLELGVSDEPGEDGVEETHGHQAALVQDQDAHQPEGTLLCTLHQPVNL